MHTTNDTLGFDTRLSEAMEDAGIPKHGRGVLLSEWLKVSKPTAHGYLHGKHLPLPDKSRILASKLKVEFDWLYSGILPKRRRQSLEEPTTTYNAKPHVFPIIQWDGDPRTVPDGHRRVPYLNARPSAGGGNALPDFIDMSRSLVFSEGWLKEKNVSPASALVTKVVGDSMAPFICDGDVVLFDSSKTRPRDNQIFVLCYFEELLIKRMLIDPDGSIKLRSDNPADPRHENPLVIPVDHSENFQIMGEFMWRGG